MEAELHRLTPPTASTREKFGGTDVPSVLVKIVNTPLPAVDAANYGPHLQVLEQVGRVAANLVADCGR